MWMVWTGGNDRLWDRLTIDSLGSFDLLKTISSHPRLGYGRHNRLRYLGLVNEPCFTEATGPDPNRFGLWLDVRDPTCPPDPFADAASYPGAKIGARGTTVRGRLVLRRADRHRRPAPVSQSGLRRERAAPLELRALLQRSGVLLGSRSRAPVPRRHVVRLLPRRPESDQAAGRSREPDVGRT